MCGGSVGGFGSDDVFFFFFLSLYFSWKTSCPIKKSMFSSYFLLIFDSVILLLIV
jgi:hypothetical protein